MTIKVTIKNEETLPHADLRVTITEVGILNGDAKISKEVEDIKPGESRTYYVYTARSVLLESYVKP